MIRALCLSMFGLLVACGSSPPPPTPAPAPAPVAANQACECACECETGPDCDCACQCDGAEVPTKLKVTRLVSPTEGPDGPDDTVEPTDWSGRVTKVDDLHYQITRELVDEILADPMDVARGARVVPSIKDGKPNGFKLYAIRPSSLYAAVGIMNGDTIRAVNGQALDAPEKALEVYSSVRNASRLELDLTRRGTDIVLVIEIQ